MCVQKNVWSSELVLAFVSVNIWRSFISCQNLGRKSDYQYEFQKPLKEVGKVIYHNKKNINQKDDLHLEKRKPRPPSPHIYLYNRCK
jgi:hypothetical protein